MIVNFFWMGKNFGFLEKMVLQSHHNVGHQIIVWLYGDEPKNRHWDEIKKIILINDANEIFSVEKFLSIGGNKRTAADLWRFYFLFGQGGLYCDTDAFALRKFFDDPWIVCSAQNKQDLLSIGVLKAPKGHEVFQKCIANIKKEWGNVQVFTDAYQEYFKNTKPTHENLLFYPYHWQECTKLFSKMEIPSSYSIHFYTKALEDSIQKSSQRRFFKDPLLKNIKKIEDVDEKWCEENPHTLIAKLWFRIS